MPTNNVTRCLLAASLSLAAAFLPAAAQTAPAPSSAQASAATVDALLKAENNLLLTTLAALGGNPRPSAGGQGGQGGQRGKSAPQRVQVEVLAVYGPAGQLRADLVSGGQLLKGARTGTRVGACSVSQIADRCVAFAPVEKAKPSQCPTACWTGKSALAASAAGATGAPLPQPFPQPSSTASYR